MSETRINRGGRPRVDATPVTVRIPPADLAGLDTWIERQPEPKPTRPEAIRRLVEVALQGDGFADLLRSAEAALRQIAKAGFTGDASLSGASARKWLDENAAALRSVRSGDK